MGGWDAGGYTFSCNFRGYSPTSLKVVPDFLRKLFSMPRSGYGYSSGWGSPRLNWPIFLESSKKIPGKWGRSPQYPPIFLEYFWNTGQFSLEDPKPYLGEGLDLCCIVLQSTHFQGPKLEKFLDDPHGVRRANGSKGSQVDPGGVRKPGGPRRTQEESGSLNNPRTFGSELLRGLLRPQGAV